MGPCGKKHFTIVRSSIHILLEGAPSELDMQEILMSLKQLNRIVDVRDLHVWTISTGMDALSGHVVIRDQWSASQNTILSKINMVLANRYDITHTTIQLEHERGISFRRAIK
jgi:cobalt-zinc-cadmium efflux system protein